MADDAPIDDTVDEERRLQAAIEHSSDLVGAVAGGALGLVGGPFGSMGGAALGVLLTKAIRHVGLDVYERVMAARQQERVGAVIAVTLSDAHEHANAGESLRDDGFFESHSGRRSAAEELLEGVLLQAANEYQELKLRHLGAILPSLAVRAEISPADGHWVMRLAERLSWRQLVVLSIFIDPPVQQLMERDVDREEFETAGPSPGLLEEVEELGTLGLLGVTTTDGDVVRAGGTFGSQPTIWGAPLAQWQLTDRGSLLIGLARLGEVSAEQRAEILAELLT